MPQLLKGVLKYKLRWTSPPGLERERAHMRDAIRAHRIVGDMSYDRKDKQGLVSSAAHAINLARDLDEVGPASAIAHSSIAMIGLHVLTLGDGRHHMDIVTAKIDEADPVTAARVLYTAGNFEFGRGNWQAGYEALDAAVLYALRAHAYRSQFITMASLANMSRLHGNIRRSRNYDHDTINVALDHGGNLVEVWALVGATKCLVSLNEFGARDEAMKRWCGCARCFQTPRIGRTPLSTAALPCRCAGAFTTCTPDAQRKVWPRSGMPPRCSGRKSSCRFLPSIWGSISHWRCA
ncbi:MAG: hypothetical protein MK180_06070 [Rhodobacteraceae bacterium]|nr:hypothetical protein [Paracoccaceae bacterium]